MQTYLPNNDAGRDGAFVGRWDGDDPAAGESTIQCKFTSQQGLNLSLSMLDDELTKVTRLAEKSLTADYIIMTNHPVTGESELAIKSAFQAAGAGRCRVFGADWITRQIRTSPRLRMMVPRLYGLGDLHELLDSRAYLQAQLILSAMGDDLQKLVVTEAHRRSVRAISEFNLVLLLGSPAAGKSTIGAGIAVGAADIWGSNTIRAISPEDVARHLDPAGGQFLWIDDAWGSKQYQRGGADAWNQVFPLMNAALRRNTRFLITSRDYIWEVAKRDLKLQSLPVLNKSQVVIDVEELSVSERAQILYNHLKMGDQDSDFRATVKPFLPALAERRDFLPETARRLGSLFFTENLVLSETGVTRFFKEPKEFLQDIIAGLSADARAAIAVLFLNGGSVRSPVSSDDIALGATAFGASAADVRSQLEALKGSLLLLAQDETGPYWTYKHPTVSDAFSSYVAESPELIEVYLRGARPDSIIFEVVCAGVHIQGAPLVVPDGFHGLLAERLSALPTSFLNTFLSYRSNRAFNVMMIEKRTDLMAGMHSYAVPIRNDSDARLFAVLHSQGLLPEDLRARFVESVREAIVDEADSSIFEDARLKAVLTPEELEDAKRDVRETVLPKVVLYIERLKSAWNNEYPPDEHFADFEKSIATFCGTIDPTAEEETPLNVAKIAIRQAVASMEDDYQEPSSTAAPVAQSTPQATGLHGLFRDVDE